MSHAPTRTRRLLWLTAGVITLTMAVPLGVIAAHSFKDVPDSNTLDLIQQASPQWRSERAAPLTKRQNRD
jgi:hypothetical protein